MLEVDQRSYKLVNAKLEKKYCRCDTIIDTWFWLEGLSVDEKSGLIARRVSKQIKTKDEKGRLIGEPT